MIVKCYDSEFEVPDILINKFYKDFDGLAGGKERQGIYQLRSHIEDITDMIAEEPELLDDMSFHADFMNALAMRAALAAHGILYDA
jgi:hypothetical protein